MNRSSGILRCSFAWLVLAGCSASPPCSDPDLDAGDAYGLAFDAGAAGPPHILLYTYSTGYRHASIPDGINAIRALGKANGFGVDVKGSQPDARGSYCANRPATVDVAYWQASHFCPCD